MLSEAGDVFLHGQFLNFRDISYTSLFSTATSVLSFFNPLSNSQKIKTPFQLNGPGLGQCRDVAGSAALTAVVAEDGSLFTFGDNLHNQAGTGSTDDLIWPPARVRNLHGVEVGSVALGANHGVVASTEGDCFTWGLNHHGQLGVGLEQLKSANTARRIPPSFFNGEAVVAVSAGMVHNAAITDAGSLYVWGKHMNEERDPNNSTFFSQYSPRRVEGIEGKVVDVASVQFGVVALVEDGRLYFLDRVPAFKSKSTVATMRHVDTQIEPRDLTPPHVVACDLRPLKGHGNITHLRDGFYGSHLVTDTGSVFEITNCKKPRQLMFPSANQQQDQDPQDAALVQDVSVSWQHSLFITKD